MHEWYKDAKLLKAAYEEFGSLKAASAAVGSPSPTCLDNWWKKLELPVRPTGSRARGTTNQDALARIYGRVKNV